MKTNAAIFGVASAASLACSSADGDTSPCMQCALFVQGVAYVSGPECSAVASGDAPLLSTGVWDLALRESYALTLLVEVPAGGQTVSLETISLSWDNGREDIAVSDAVAASEEETGWVTVDIAWSPEDSAALAAQTSVRIAARGVGADGRGVNSEEFQFPVQVCSGCLVHFPVIADDVSLPAYQCTAFVEGVGAAPCRVGQDEPVDCRHCNEQPICFAPPV